MEEESMEFYAFYSDGMFSNVYASQEELLEQMSVDLDENNIDVCLVTHIHGVWNALVHEAKLGDRQDDEWMEEVLKRVLQVVKDKKKLLKDQKQ